ncbi:MAG: anti-sigma factor [Nocardioides sp.]
MSAMPHADLVGLLRGDLANDDVESSGDHLRSCPTCRGELVENALGHSLLTRSARTLGTEAVTPPPLPPVAELVATYPTARGPRGLRLLVVAAALTTAAGVGAVAQSQVNSDDGPEPQRSATLQAVSGAGGGTVSMTEARGRTAMTISTHDLPAVRDGQFYYAWLLDPTTNKMLPLGQVGPSGTAYFEVSDRLLAAYAAVDVSLEDDDGDPQHSPTSVLRASYA